YNYQEVKALKAPGGAMMRYVAKVGDQYLVPVRDQGIYRLLASADSLAFELLPGTKPLTQKVIVGILPSSGADLLIATAGHGIYVYQAGEFRLWDSPLQGQWRQSQLNKVCQLMGGGYAVGTILNGLYLIDGEGKLKHHLDQGVGLQNNTVLSLYQDREENLWVGLDRGVDMLALKAPLTVYQDLNGQLGAVYAAVEFQDRLYLGTNHGVFVGSLSGQEPFSLMAGTQGQVWFLKVAQGELLIGHNDGTYAWNGQELYEVSSQNGGWSLCPRTAHPKQWLLGTYGGLHLLKYVENEGWQEAWRISWLGTSVKQVMADEQGGYWVVHPYQGLQRIDLNEAGNEILELTTFGPTHQLPTEYNLRLMKHGKETWLRADSSFFQIGYAAGELTLTSAAAEPGLRLSWQTDDQLTIFS
ncbi:MAG: two-component regulator propeller domain-containing protein, partial [Bacteroidota bacterium]